MTNPTEYMISIERDWMRCVTDQLLNAILEGDADIHALEDNGAMRVAAARELADRA
tara:strand:- start:2928 stop:3095 length:168 start_codon:yes stop_codon:yes gene_type:complete